MTHNSQTKPVDNELLGSRILKFGPDASKVLVAKLIDCYLAEIARYPNLLLSKFVNLGETIASFLRPSHDELYRVINMYLQVICEHTSSAFFIENFFF